MSPNLMVQTRTYTTHLQVSKPANKRKVKANK